MGLCASTTRAGLSLRNPAGAARGHADRMDVHEAREEQAGPRSDRRAALAAAAALGVGVALAGTPNAARSATAVALVPPAAGDGPRSLQAALAARRSVRRYKAGSLSTAHLSALLWAAQGVSGEPGLRTAPSAGARYPLEIHLVVRDLEGLAAGVHRYLPATHSIEPGPGDATARRLVQAAGGQEAVGVAPLVLVIAAVHARTAARYGARADRYVAFEAGAAAQNVGLMAAALGLGTVVIGAFDDDGVARVLQLPAGVRPLALMPVGRPA